MTPQLLQAHAQNRAHVLHEAARGGGAAVVGCEVGQASPAHEQGLGVLPPHVEDERVPQAGELAHAGHHGLQLRDRGCAPAQARSPVTGDGQGHASRHAQLRVKEPAPFPVRGHEIAVKASGVEGAEEAVSPVLLFGGHLNAAAAQVDPVMGIHHPLPFLSTETKFSRRILVRASRRDERSISRVSMGRSSERRRMMSSTCRKQKLCT